MTKRTPPYGPEVRARAVRMVMDHQEEHGSQWAAIQSIASKIGCSGETPRNWARRTERDDGARPGPTSAEKEELAQLRHENRTAPGERDPQEGVGLFRDGGARPPVGAMKAFIDAHREVYGGTEFISRDLDLWAYPQLNY